MASATVVSARKLASGTPSLTSLDVAAAPPDLIALCRRPSDLREKLTCYTSCLDGSEPFLPEYNLSCPCTARLHFHEHGQRSDRRVEFVGSMIVGLFSAAWLITLAVWSPADVENRWASGVLWLPGPRRRHSGWLSSVAAPGAHISPELVIRLSHG